ncbi:unnamed protein product [Leptosia nina]|uniref:Wiskott-Aldrich syndrome protein family member n=1 Tax=Leptosia nina TaxID=320188 RepID=A0AAV1JCD4_9NEOP
MPFVERVVEPTFLSRTSLRDENGKQKVTDEELQAVTNCTLSNALRQLASLVLLAEDIFSELTGQLEVIRERSKTAQAKIETISELVEKYDPKKVPVHMIESLSNFSPRNKARGINQAKKSCVAKINYAHNKNRHLLVATRRCHLTSPIIPFLGSV